MTGFKVCLLGLVLGGAAYVPLTLMAFGERRSRFRLADGKFLGVFRELGIRSVGGAIPAGRADHRRAVLAAGAWRLRRLIAPQTYPPRNVHLIRGAATLTTDSAAPPPDRTARPMSARRPSGFLGGSSPSALSKWVAALEQRSPNWAGSRAAQLPLSIVGQRGATIFAQCAAEFSAVRGVGSARDHLARLR
jgi:hypothetical protein